MERQKYPNQKIVEEKNRKALKDSEDCVQVLALPDNLGKSINFYGLQFSHL